MTTNSAPGAQRAPLASDPPDPRLPWLGPVLAGTWVITGAVWLFLTATVDSFYRDYWLTNAGSALGAVIVVAVPLLLPQLPATLRRQALPFLVLSAAMPLVEPFAVVWVSSLLLIHAEALYVIGWLRLRGRDPRHYLLALSVPLTYGLGDLVSKGLDAQPLVPRSMAALTAVFVFESSLLTAALPVCLPLLVSTLLTVRDLSSAAVPDRIRGLAPRPGGTRLNPMAMASVSMGLIGGNVIAILLAYLARSQIRRSDEGGSGAAKAGLVSGYIGVIAVTMMAVIGWLWSKAFEHFTF